MVHRCDLDIGFQHPEAPLDVGQGLVPGDRFGRRKILGIGQEDRISIERFGIGVRVVIQGPTRRSASMNRINSASDMARANRLYAP